jgi:hypothetical protein
MKRLPILKHHYYCNGAYGRAWGVRLVTQIDSDPANPEEIITFKGIAGHCRRKAGSCSHTEFLAWAKYEVALNENSWLRVAE